MPLTRSQKGKDVPLSASSTASQYAKEMSERARSEGSTSVMTSEATASNISSKASIAESSGTTVTESTKATKMRSTENSARLKQLQTTEGENQNRSLMIEKPGGSNRASVKSVRTKSSAARLRNLEAREELARLELERIEAAANLARIRLKKQTIEDSASEDDLDEELDDRASRVQNWIQTSPLEDIKDIKPEKDLQENQGIVKTEQPLMSMIQTLADAHEDKEPADLVLMSQFLNKQADKCGAYAPSEKKKQQSGREATHSTREEEEDEPQRTKKEVNKEKKWTCISCQGDHYLTECQRFLKMPVEERWALAVKQRICFKCLRGRHRKEKCRKPACKSCKLWHHFLLHSEQRTSEQKSEASNAAHGQEEKYTKSIQALMAEQGLPPSKYEKECYDDPVLE